MPIKFKKKSSPPGLQGQINSALVAHVLGDDVHPDTGKTGIEHTGVKALIPLDIIVGEIIVVDAGKKAFDNSFQTPSISTLLKSKQLTADRYLFRTTRH